MRRISWPYISVTGFLLLAFLVAAVMAVTRRNPCNRVGEACDMAFMAGQLGVLLLDEANEREQRVALRRIAEARCSSGAHHIAWFAGMHPTLGTEAIDTLQRLGDRQARDAMLETLGSAHEQTSVRAVEALAEMGDARSLPYLESMLNGQLWTVPPAQVFRAMGMVGGPVSLSAKERIAGVVRSIEAPESERIWAAFAALEIDWDSELSLSATAHLLDRALEEGPWQDAVLEAISRVSHPAFGVHRHELWDTVLRAVGASERRCRAERGVAGQTVPTPERRALNSLLRHAALSPNRRGMAGTLHLAATAYGLGEDDVAIVIKVLRQIDPLEYHHAQQYLRSR